MATECAEGVPFLAVKSTRRAKSKGGCKTCRTRKVKCDECRPACLRCTSTGRVCDGYGVFGGGSICQANPKSKLSVLSNSYSPNVMPGTAFNTDEQFHFEWYFCRTARKLSGAFQSPQSNAFIFQACIADRAVSHATIALCSVHRHAVLYHSQAHSQFPSTEERFALVQYNKAIQCLPRNSEIRSPLSLRIALFLASTLTVVESLRGSYRTAKLHLKFGLRLLEQLRCISSENEPSSGNGSQVHTDEYFFRTFKRLYVQYALLLEPRVSWACNFLARPVSQLHRFGSTDEARAQLEDILLDLRQLDLNDVLGRSVVQCSARGRFRKAIIKDLTAWKTTYDETMSAYNSTFERQKWFAYKLLHLYYTMASIMRQALQEDECIYDLMTPQFVSMLQQLLIIRDIASRPQLRAKYFGPEDGLTHSIADMGVLCPLYFIAVKCRVPRIRLQAMALLDETPRHEYIWDSTLVVAIARKVMQLEEGDAYDKVVANTDVCPTSVPDINKLDGPAIPLRQRLRYVDIRLPDNTHDPVAIRYRRQSGKEAFLVVF